MSQPTATDRRYCFVRQELPTPEPERPRALPPTLTCTRHPHEGDPRHFDGNRLVAWQADGDSIRLATVLPSDFPEAAALAQLGQQESPVAELAVTGPGRVTWDGRLLRFEPGPEPPCSCYPGGINPADYEGPQPWCDLHGQPSAAWRLGLADGIRQQAAVSEPALRELLASWLYSAAEHLRAPDSLLSSTEQAAAVLDRWGEELERGSRDLWSCGRPAALQ